MAFFIFFPGLFPVICSTAVWVIPWIFFSFYVTAIWFEEDLIHGLYTVKGVSSPACIIQKCSHMNITYEKRYLQLWVLLRVKEYLPKQWSSTCWKKLHQVCRKNIQPLQTLLHKLISPYIHVKHFMGNC